MVPPVVAMVITLKLTRSRTEIWHDIGPSVYRSFSVHRTLMYTNVHSLTYTDVHSRTLMYTYVH